MNSLLSKIMLIVAFCFASLASAYDIGPVRLNGYLNQLYINNSGNNFLVPTTEGSFDYGEAALSAFYRPTNNLYLTGGIISRNLGEMDRGTYTLKSEYALFGYTLLSESQIELTLRGGRIKYPYGLYNDVRGVASVIPGAMLPQTMYYDYTRVGLYRDGFQLDAMFRLGDFGDIQFNISHGKSASAEESLESLYGVYKANADYVVSLLGQANPDMDYDYGYKRSNVLNLVYYSAEGGLTIRYSKGLPAEMDIILENNLVKYKVDTYSVNENYSIEYLGDNFSIIAEKNKLDINTNNVFTSPYYPPGYAYQQKSRSESYYIQGNYQLSSDWGIYLRNEHYYPDRHDKKGENFSDPKYAYSTVWVLGGTYNIMENLFVRAEYQNIEGAALVNPVDNVGRTDYDRYWGIFAMQVSYSF